MEKSGKLSLHYSYYVVTVIDVLGQKKRIKELSNIPPYQDSEFLRELVHLHEDTAYYLEKLRGNFEAFFNDSAESKLTIPVPENKIAEFEAMRTSHVNYSYFSDTMVASVCLETDLYHVNAANGVYRILCSCGGLLLFSLFLEKPFRAGIEVGLGTRMKSGEVYGPALVCAHELESHVAQFPRIVVGQELMNYLRNLSNRIPQKEKQLPDDIDACKRISDKCLGMIAKDVDGNLILDYLANNFLELYSRSPDSWKLFLEVHKGAYSFVRDQYLRWAHEENTKLASRYKLLLDYFEKRMPKLDEI